MKKEYINLEQRVKDEAHCWFEGWQELVYSAPISDNLKDQFEYGAFCCCDSDKCPFYKKIKNHTYCTAFNQ